MRAVNARDETAASNEGAVLSRAVDAVNAGRDGRDDSGFVGVSTGVFIGHLLSFLSRQRGRWVFSY